MRIEIIPLGSNDKGWEVEICFEVLKGCYAVRIDLLYVRLHSHEGEILDITDVWEELVPNLQSELKKRVL